VKWEVREMEDGRWGVYLLQEFCKTDEPVCYCASTCKETADRASARWNNPDTWLEEDEEN
jgi:hypothetical protein